MSNADDRFPPTGSTLKTALSRLVTTLDGRSIRYAIIGGIATILHGRARTTNDDDVPQTAMPALFGAPQAVGCQP